jgi:hypothetical protein
VADFCKHGDEPSDSIKKAGYFLISWVTSLTEITNGV